jgi:hypothetical protein
MECKTETSGIIMIEDSGFDHYRKLQHKIGQKSTSISLRMLQLATINLSKKRLFFMQKLVLVDNYPGT